MQKTFQHFLYVPFTGLGLHGGYRGDKWLKNRLEIFKTFVLPSILNQSNKNFTVWFSWRKEDAYNPIVERFVVEMSHERIDMMHTYCGVMFWDDKYSDEEAASRLYRTLEETLPKLTTYCINATHVLMTIQPSDDMYLPSMVDRTQEFFQRTESYDVYGYERGYIMNYATLDIAEYNPETTPPFYTICFPHKNFLTPTLHFKFTGPYKSHEYVKDFLRDFRGEERGFVVGTHGENISTTFVHPYTGRILDPTEADTLRYDIGIERARPVAIRRSGRLIARTLLNSLPFQRQIRDLYYKLPIKLQIL